MTAFLILASAMVAAALLWMVTPLWRQPALQAADGRASGRSSRAERGIAGAAVAVLVPVLAVVMYTHLSKWDWKAAEELAANQAQTDALLVQLEDKLRANPQDVEGWLLLGRSYGTLNRLPEAAKAFQHAYDASRGQNVEAIIGLGQALALSDESALSGRAGELFNVALEKSPNDPRALWYGAIASLQSGDLRQGRDRLARLLAQNPPEELRAALQQQIRELDQQLGGASGGVASATPADGQAGRAGERSVKVSVAIAPQIQQQLAADTPLFVLARDPAGGPPLAVQRHSTAAVPLTIELSESDAMMPTRTLASAPRVQVVARISRSGSPQARSGDFYGEADYDFSAAGGAVSIVIDKIVP